MGSSLYEFNQMAKEGGDRKAKRLQETQALAAQQQFANAQALQAPELQTRMAVANIGADIQDKTNQRYLDIYNMQYGPGGASDRSAQMGYNRSVDTQGLRGESAAELAAYKVAMAGGEGGTGSRSKKSGSGGKDEWSSTVNELIKAGVIKTPEGARDAYAMNTPHSASGIDPATFEQKPASAQGTQGSAASSSGMNEEQYNAHLRGMESQAKDYAKAKGMEYVGSAARDGAMARFKRPDGVVHFADINAMGSPVESRGRVAPAPFQQPAMPMGSSTADMQQQRSGPGSLQNPLQVGNQTFQAAPAPSFNAGIGVHGSGQQIPQAPVPDPWRNQPPVQAPSLFDRYGQYMQQGSAPQRFMQPPPAIQPQSAPEQGRTIFPYGSRRETTRPTVGSSIDLSRKRRQQAGLM